MKKTIALILAVILAAFCFTGCGLAGFGSDEEEAVMTVDGRTVTWNEYMYWLNTAAAELQSYYANAGKSGIKWSDPCMFDSGITNAEWCVKRATQTVTEMCAIENYTEKKGVTLSDEEKAEIDDYISQYIEYYCGEDATEEDFDKLLNEEYLTLDYYRHMMYMNMSFQKLFENEYGANAEKLDDAVALAYGEENDFITAAHILFKTVDDQREPLDDETIASKKAQAESLAAELKAISDKDELRTKFREYQDELSEDPGKVSMPDGYCFGTGVMDQNFDAAARALAENEVSDVVESAHGYHIIMRLPQNLDIAVSSTSTSGTLRYLAASEQFNDTINALVKEATCKLTGDYKNYDFTTLFGSDGFAGWLMTDDPAESAAPEE